MRVFTKRNTSHRQITDNRNRSETAVATIWLVFYMLALGIAISSPIVSAAIDVAAR